MNEQLRYWGLVALASALLLGGIWAVGKAFQAKRDRFMDECRNYRPNYECEALWRATR